MNLIAFLNGMHLTPFSAAAYAVAWLIYLGYLGRIVLRMKKVAAEREELERTLTRSADAPSLTRSAS